MLKLITNVASATFLLVLFMACGANAESRLPPCPTDRNVVWDNCHGTLTWPDGRKYVGEVKDGKGNGQGTYTWPNREKYVGEWNDSKRNGPGTLYLSNGSVIRTGIWKDDTLAESAAETSSNKAITSALGLPEKTDGYLPLSLSSLLIGGGIAIAIAAIFLRTSRIAPSIKGSKPIAPMITTSKLEGKMDPPLEVEPLPISEMDSGRESLGIGAPNPMEAKRFFPMAFGVIIAVSLGFVVVAGALSGNPDAKALALGVPISLAATVPLVAIWFAVRRAFERAAGGHATKARQFFTLAGIIIAAVIGSCIILYAAREVPKSLAVATPPNNYTLGESILRDCGATVPFINEMREANLRCVFEFGADKQINIMKYDLLQVYFTEYFKQHPIPPALKAWGHAHARECDEKFPNDMTSPASIHCLIEIYFAEALADPWSALK